MRTRSVKAGLMACAAGLLAACAPSGQNGTAAPGEGSAKNIILFVGDGMGLSTVTAARIFDGQTKGMLGEENQLSFETFPNLALVKTFNLDAQVPDSAGTASAMMTGRKTQIGKLNVQPDALDAGCGEGAKVPIFTDLAKAAGWNLGVVSTTRITHATPAATYARARSRDFESDRELDAAAKAKNCPDIAAQLLAYEGLDVVLGGGRRAFRPASDGGRRQDGRDLTAAWQGKSAEHIYAGTAEALRNMPSKKAKNVLGLFSDSHLAFEADRKDNLEPSLEEMTSYAIENLAARKGNYFLMVEAGRIDHAHHGTNAYRALVDTQEFSQAIAEADRLTKDDETLILVTADHSHVFTMAGYPARGNPILGLVHTIDGKTGKRAAAPDEAKDGNPYTTLGYQNGPVLRSPDLVLTDEMVQNPSFRQQAAVPRSYETHAGEDVPLYAKGPGSDAVRGVIDQAEIFNIMRMAAGLE